jgi:hypothetical protein
VLDEACQNGVFVLPADVPERVSPAARSTFNWYKEELLDPTYLPGLLVDAPTISVETEDPAATLGAFLEKYDHLIRNTGGVVGDQMWPLLFRLAALAACDAGAGRRAESRKRKMSSPKISSSLCFAM